MNDIESLREALDRELEGLQPSPPTRGFLKRARRRRASHVAGVAILSVAVLAGIALPLKALAPLGDRDSRIRPAGTPSADDLTGQELAEALGLVAQDELPEGCKSYAVPPWSAPKGFCLDGHYTTESESWQLSERLRGIVPSATDIKVHELVLQLADAKVRNDAEATASLQRQIRALTEDRTVAGTFPAGDPKSCPEQLPSSPAEGVQQEVTNKLMLTAGAGRWPWKDVDASTQALFASQEDYEGALSGVSRGFDLSIMSSVPPGSGDMVASIVEGACGAGAWPTSFVTVRAELLRSEDKQAVDLVFVSRPEGPKLWLALLASHSEAADGGSATAPVQLEANSRSQLPSGQAIADVYGLKLVKSEPSSWAGCHTFAEVDFTVDVTEGDATHGYCLDSAILGRGASLLGSAITGRPITASEVATVEKMMTLQRLRSSGDSDTVEAAALGTEISTEVDTWWEERFSKSAEDNAPDVGPAGPWDLPAEKH